MQTTNKGLKKPPVCEPRLRPTRNCWSAVMKPLRCFSSVSERSITSTQIGDYRRAGSAEGA